MDDYFDKLIETLRKYREEKARREEENLKLIQEECLVKEIGTIPPEYRDWALKNNCGISCFSYFDLYLMRKEE